jgi:hypothetical protein
MNKDKILTYKATIIAFAISILLMCSVYQNSLPMYSLTRKLTKRKKPRPKVFQQPIQFFPTVKPSFPTVIPGKPSFMQPKGKKSSYDDHRFDEKDVGSKDDFLKKFLRQERLRYLWNQLFVAVRRILNRTYKEEIKKKKQEELKASIFGN